MEAENGDNSLQILLKNKKLTSFQATIMMIKSTDGVALFGKWETNTQEIINMMKETAGDQWNGSMAVFTKVNGCEESNKASE